MHLLNFIEFLPPDDSWWSHFGINPVNAVGGAWSQAEHTLTHLDSCNAVNNTYNADLDLNAISLRFFENGCARSDGSTNCTAACAISADLLASYSTLWNCVTLARLAIWKQSNPKVPVCEELYAMILSAGGRLEVPSVASFDGVGVLEKVFDCANASCAHDNNSCSLPPLDTNVTDFYDSNFLNATNDVCRHYTTTMNADVAGPGVLTTYIMETVLAIYILAVSRLYKFDQAIITFQHWFRANLHSPPSADNYSGQFTTFLKKLKSTRFFHTTVQFCADFQEAQSFMILAASIATIIAFSQPVVFGGGDTWIAIQANKRIVILPATAGMISMTTTQLALHRLGKSSVYSLVFATIACALVVGILFNQPSYTYDQVYHQLKNEHTLPQCGGNPSMKVFCDSYGDWNLQDTLRPAAAILSLVILASLWFSKLRSLYIVTRNQNPGNSHRQRLGIIVSLKDQHLRKAFRFCAQALQGFFGSVYWVYDILSLYILGDTIKELTKSIRNFAGTSSIDGHEPGYQPLLWNMGQVIAVLVWSPVLAKYIYALLFGLERGFELRLPADFVVKRRDAVPTFRRISSSALNKMANTNGKTDSAESAPTVALNSSENSASLPSDKLTVEQNIIQRHTF